MRKLITFAITVLGLASLLCASRANAQTTYTLNKEFFCDAVSAQPIYSVTEFTCKVNNPIPYPITLPNFLDANGNKVGFYWWDSLDRVYVITSAFTMYNGTFQLTNFSLSTDSNGNTKCGYKNDPCTVPGTYAFTWQGTDTNGNPHNGTASGTWLGVQECGGRGCYWFAPALQPGSTATVNQ